MFYKYLRVFCSQLLRSRLFQVSCIIMYIVCAFADNHSVIVKSQSNLIQRYVIQQTLMIIGYPLIIMPICLNDEFIALYSQLLTLYTHRIREAMYALWLAFTGINAIPFVIGTAFNFLFQSQYTDISIRITLCYMFIGVSEMAVAYAAYIMLFLLFKKSFITMVVYFIMMFFASIVPTIFDIAVVGLPITIRGLDLLYTNASLVIISRIAYLLVIFIPPILLFMKDKQAKNAFN